MSDRRSLFHEFTMPEDRLEALCSAFDHLEGVALIDALYQSYGDKVAAITSFGANAPLLLAQIAWVNPGMAIYTADTGSYTNPNIEHNRDMLRHKLGLENVNITHLDEQKIDGLTPGQCCGHFKKAALNERVENDGIEIVIAGLNSSESRGRQDVQKFALSEDHKHIIVNPNAKYNDADINDELYAHGLGAFVQEQRVPTCAYCDTSFCGMWSRSIARGPA